MDTTYLPCLERPSSLSPRVLCRTAPHAQAKTDYGLIVDPWPTHSAAPAAPSAPARSPSVGVGESFSFAELWADALESGLYVGVEIGNAW